jgi:tRNA pseudouridine38-40 synthase
MKTTRWRAVCAYDGTGFGGWQSQPHGNAIQDHIESRLAIVMRAPVRIHGSGRTDAGVHARGQVFHFDASWPHGPKKLQAALRVGLPSTIQVMRLKEATPDFHARFSAQEKRYTYHIFEGTASPFEHPFVLSRERPRRLDLAKMNAAAEILRGRHDFRAFAADNGAELDDPVRNLKTLEIRAQGPRVKLVFTADGFLYKMVRSLTGALIAVGEGRLSVDTLRRALQSGQRTELIETAPAQGLFLDRVFY